MKKVSFKKEEMLQKITSAPTYEIDFAFGLNSNQVESRIKDGLVNKTPKKVTKTYWQIFCDNVFSFFNLVFFAIAIMMICAQVNITYFFFLIPILCNIILGVLADINARRLVDKLRLLTDPKTTVIRNGKEEKILPQELVLSDVLLLSSGDQVPSDCLVMNGKCEMDESLLTGESDSVLKKVGDQLFSGSYVRSGKVRCKVNRVGLANYVEGLNAAAKQFKRPNSELKGTYLKLFFWCGIIAIFIGLMTFITWIIQSIYGGDGLTFASYQEFAIRFSGSLTAMIPAGLYLLTSLTLTIGIINLAQKRMNVQELYCIEMLARVDVLCFDKTGTLTDGTLVVKDVYLGTDKSEDEIKRLLRSLLSATGDENNTALALLNYVGKGPEYSKNAAIPFDSERKWSAASFAGIGSFLLGAPDIVTGKKNEELTMRMDSLTKKGFRVLGLYFSPYVFKNGEFPTKLSMVGLVVLSDHVKEDAKANIEWFVQNGVSIKVISGDNADTVASIAKECGVPNANSYISLANVSDQDIPLLAERYSVFGRVKPEQKALLVEALQSQGHKVAMTGDGVNDIIALKKADCSIAMASGSSAARNASHIVSLENDFSRLPDVVAEGRRVINNLQRTASLFLSKTVFAMVLSLIFLIVSWAGGPNYPFSTKNMFIWEVGSIGAGGFFLALQPTNDKLQGSFVKNILKKAIPAGSCSILIVLTMYLISFINPEFLPLDIAKNCAVIGFSIMAYFILFQVCLPFDLYRAIVFFGLLACGGIAFGIDAGLSLNFFDIQLTGMNTSHLILLLSISFGVGLVYLLVNFLCAKKKKKGQEKI